MLRARSRPPPWALLSFFLLSCADETPVVELCLGGDDCPSDASGLDAAATDAYVAPVFDVPRDRVSATDLLSIALDPADPTLTGTATTRPTATFRVMGLQRDGRRREITQLRRFSLDSAALGVIDAETGAFTGTGIGGTSRVRVALVDGSALTAETTVTVNVTHVTLQDGLTEDDRARVDAMRATGLPAETPLVDYPLSGAVFPQNVYPPLLQWTPRRTSSDRAGVVRVRLTRPHARVEAWLRTSATGYTHSWRPSREAWRAIAGSDLLTPITLTVATLTDGVFRESEARVFRTVDAVIAGSVYYWSPPASRLRRIDVDEARRVDFLPNPGDTCIGCHAVSRDGRQLAGFLEGTGENLGLYDLTRDLTGRPAPMVARVRYSVRRCTSYNPDGSRLVSGDCGANPSAATFTLINGRDGTPVTATGSPGNGFDPEWSPDGRLIAYTTRMDALAATPSLAGDRFGDPIPLHAPVATQTNLRMDWHPTWTPDSQWIAFQRGEARRTAMGRGSLWMIARNGGAVVRMDNANFGATGEASFRPVFSPFNSGGYFWLLFTTTHPYGNQWAGVRAQKQIWVVAVRARPDGRSDPSAVPYYLDGQEVATALSPYWAPAPCRANTTECSTGADCCSGNCEPDGSGRNVCVPSRMACVMRGGRCGGNDDCCMGLVCTSNLCDLPPPM